MPTVTRDQWTGMVKVDINPYYQFVKTGYEVEIRSVLTRHLGEIVDAQFFDRVAAEVHEVLMRAWHQGDLLVDWPEPRKPLPVDDALQVPIEMTEEDEAQFLVRLFEQESHNPLNDREHTLLAEFWEFLKGRGKVGAEDEGGDEG